jgi:hypothetical protein
MPCKMTWWLIAMQCSANTYLSGKCKYCVGHILAVLIKMERPICPTHAFPHSCDMPLTPCIFNRKSSDKCLSMYKLTYTTCILNVATHTNLFYINHFHPYWSGLFFLSPCWNVSGRCQISSLRLSARESLCRIMCQYWMLFLVGVGVMCMKIKIHIGRFPCTVVSIASVTKIF